MNVTKQAIDQVSAVLKELPEKPKEKLLLREAVDQLRDQIKAALSKGYSYDEVAAMLTTQGIEISTATLKRYVPAGRNRSTKRKTADAETPKRRSRKANTEETTTVASSSSEVTELIAESTVEPKSNGRRSRRAASEAAPAKTKRTPTRTTTRSSSRRRKEG